MDAEDRGQRTERSMVLASGKLEIVTSNKKVRKRQEAIQSQQVSGATAVPVTAGEEQDKQA